MANNKLSQLQFTLSSVKKEIEAHKKREGKYSLAQDYDNLISMIHAVKMEMITVEEKETEITKGERL